MTNEEIKQALEKGKFMELVNYFKDFDSFKIEQLVTLSAETENIAYYFLVDYIAVNNSDWRFFNLASTLLYSDYVFLSGAGNLSYIKLKQAISLNPSNLNLWLKVLNYWKFPDATVPDSDFKLAIKHIGSEADKEYRDLINSINSELAN